MAFPAAPISKPVLLFLVSEDWYFISHRLALAKAARDQGYEVVVATCVNQGQQEIERAGIQVIPLDHFDRTRIGFLKELRSLYEIWEIYRQVRPQIVHHVAMKPVLYGSIISTFARVPQVVNAIAGLGYMFINQSWKTYLLRMLLKIVLIPLFRFKNSMLIVQNEEDQEFIQKTFHLPSSKITLIRGAGIDLEQFSYKPEPETDHTHPPKVILAARMVRDKGVIEVIQAIRLIKQAQIPAHFIFCGLPDPQNPLSLTLEQLQQWEKEGLIEWRGKVQDMASLYQHSHLAILCSYREGTPKSLLEAAACGRAIITTTVAGCQQVVIHQLTGLLIPPRQEEPIFEALKLLLTNSVLRQQMGKKGRELMIEKFCLSQVITQTLAVYEEMKKD